MSSRTSPVLIKGYFKKLPRASAQFSGYLRETHGEDEDEREVLEKIRAMPTRRKVNASFFSNDEDDSDGLSDSDPCSDSSGEWEVKSFIGSGTESFDAGKIPNKNGKEIDGVRS